MDAQEYSDVLELIGDINRVERDLGDIVAIMNTYFPTKHMTLKEAEEFLWNRRIELLNKLRQKLGVGNDKTRSVE